MRFRKGARKFLNDLEAAGTWWLRQSTAPLRVLPDLIIIGTQKGGTSSLYEYLGQHPWIFPALKKEVHFFDTGNFARGLDWYRAHFNLNLQKRYANKSGRCNPITGEASPYYLFHPHAAERVARILPKARIIVMLRNPVDRALSHYCHQVRKGREPLTFEAAIAVESERLRGEYERMLRDETYYSYACWAYSYLARGLYADQLSAWFKVFPKKQFLFIKSEDFFSNPCASFKQTLRFLELPEIGLREYNKKNAGTYTSMSMETRQKLSQYFEPHNKRLYDLLHTDLAWET
jgi:hypothetical protein